jgi:hydrogenase expression/formation protein HypC
MKIISVKGNRAIVDAGGVELPISLDLVEDVVPGDYVIVHAGFAIQRLSDDDAAETLAIFERLELCQN